MSRRAALAVISILFALLSCGAVGQELERVSGESVGWWWYDNASAEAIGAALDEHGARLIDLEITSASPLRFSACMIKNSGSYASSWWWYYGVDANHVSELLDELKARIIDLEVHYVDGQRRFTVILVPNTGPQAKSWWWYFGITAETLSDLIEQHSARLVDLEVLTQSGQQRYAAVMVCDTGEYGETWSWHVGISPGDISEILSSQVVRILDLERMSDGRFAVILLRPRSESWSWWWWFGLSEHDVADVVNQTGGRIVDIEPHTHNGAIRYDVVLTGSDDSSDRGASVEGMARKVYPIDIVLTTTSDWTSVRFLGSEIDIQEQTILEGSEADGLEIETSSTLYVAQHCCDITPIQVRIRALLCLADPSEWLQMQIEKGHIGQTTVALHVPGDPDPIATYRHAGVADNPDPANTRTFKIYCPYLTADLTRILASPSE